MTRLSAFKMLAACAATAAGGALAHVTLPPGGATAGSDYEAAFRVGHPCKDAKSTTGITVRLPQGFTLEDAQARKGWTLDVQKTGESQVRWTADSAASALPTGEKAEFILRGKLTTTPGPLYFKVLQACENGNADWAQLPTDGADAKGGSKSEFPAARLDVLAPGVAPVDVKDAWIRPAVPGQSGTGAFMKLSAPSGARLVGVSTPAAGIAEVHEMKMEGDTMRMRPVQGGLALPARQTVELKPSGYHVMLMDLKQAMPKGTAVPLTLRFEDARGVQTQLDVNVTVGAPDAAAAPSHNHMH